MDIVPSDKERLKRLETSMTNVKSNLSAVKKDVSSNTSEIEDIKPKVKENTEDIKSNNKRIQILEKRQHATDTDMKLVKTNLSNVNMDITDLEKHVASNKDSIETLDKKHTEELNEAHDELVKLYDNIIAINDRLEEDEYHHNKFHNCEHHGHGHNHNHNHDLPEHECNCPYCTNNKEEIEDVVSPATPTIMDKLVAKYLKEHINNLFCTIIPRHDISTNWTINDPILTLGEYGVEDDTHRLKRGDGETKWSELPYETFGIESLAPSNASDVNYDNAESGLEMYNVQEVLDYLVELNSVIERKLDRKEDIRNKKTDLTDANNTTYPTTRAVVDYVKDKIKEVEGEIQPGDSCDCKVVIPEIPDMDGSYMLYCHKGIIEWKEASLSQDGLEQKVKDLEQEVNDLKDIINNLVDLNEEEF